MKDTGDPMGKCGKGGSQGKGTRQTQKKWGEGKDEYQDTSGLMGKCRQGGPLWKKEVDKYRRRRNMGTV